MQKLVYPVNKSDLSLKKKTDKISSAIRGQCNAFHSSKSGECYIAI